MFRGGEGGPHNPILRVPTKPSAWLLPWDPSKVHTYGFVPPLMKPSATVVLEWRPARSTTVISIEKPPSGLRFFRAKSGSTTAVVWSVGFSRAFFICFYFLSKINFIPKNHGFFFRMAFVYAIFWGADLVATTQNTQKFRFLQPPGIAWASFPCASSRCGAKPGVGRGRGGQLHPGRLTWNIIMEVWKMIFLSKWVICRFHVNLPGCNDSDDC